MVEVGGEDSGVDAVPRLKLAARDLAIFRHLALHGFATADQIHGLFWKGAKGHHNHYSRLRKLELAGLIAQLRGDLGQRLGYKLTKKGERIARQVDPELPRASVRGRVCYRTTFEHDRHLVDVWNILSRCALVGRFQQEREIRSHFAARFGFAKLREQGFKVPDALFDLTTPRAKFRFALELELSQKSSERYRKHFRLLSTCEEWNTVLFVVKNAKIKAVLKDELKRSLATDPMVKLSPRTNKFYFVELSEILERGLAAKIEGERTSFSFEELEKKYAVDMEASPKHDSTAEG